MLWASKRWPQDIGALALLDGTDLVDATGRFRIEAVREAIGARLHLAPRFRQVVRTPPRGLGGPAVGGRPITSISVTTYASTRCRPEAARRTSSTRSSGCRRQRLDPSRPLWEMWFLPGLPDGRIGAVSCGCTTARRRYGGDGDARRLPRRRAGPADDLRAALDADGASVRTGAPRRPRAQTSPEGRARASLCSFDR